GLPYQSLPEPVYQKTGRCTCASKCGSVEVVSPKRRRADKGKFRVNSKMALPNKHSSKASVKAGDKLSSAPPQGSIRKNYLFSKLWLFLSLGLLILVFYSNSFNAGLLFDSDTIIRLDPRLRGLHWANVEQIFTHDYWWPSDQSVLYRPLTTFSYLFNYTILGNGE